MPSGEDVEGMIRVFTACISLAVVERQREGGSQLATAVYLVTRQRGLRQPPERSLHVCRLGLPSLDKMGRQVRCTKPAKPRIPMLHIAL